MTINGLWVTGLFFVCLFCSDPEVVVIYIRNRDCCPQADSYNKMASQLSRVWSGLCRARINSAHLRRAVSQSRTSSAAGAASVTDLQPAAHADDSHGHAEVNPFDKVRYRRREQHHHLRI